jgi:hypothetical protein
VASSFTAFSHPVPCLLTQAHSPSMSTQSPDPPLSSLLAVAGTGLASDEKGAKVCSSSMPHRDCHLGNLRFAECFKGASSSTFSMTAAQPAPKPSGGSCSPPSVAWQLHWHRPRETPLSRTATLGKILSRLPGQSESGFFSPFFVRLSHRSEDRRSA